ncbi:hypothetical protein LTR37_011909 [Vermiconidia calcicola]|uniref:Uncharacterized protein n=1 Tax=Vermiconidia calcicola TaxID=1690605 RepID=A0ACC3N200_9PEZI|nr:hypothetical protein LTR37_011909 [Vermiconidia calcicola]
MATANESWQQVLDGADDATAQVILDLILGDADGHDSVSVEQDADTLMTDYDIARSIYAAELKQYRGGRTFTYVTTAPDSINNNTSPEPEPIEGPNGPMLFSCIICQDMFDADHCWQVPCQHYYCDGCLNDLFRVAMENEQAYPPRCCTQTVPFEDVRIMLEPNFAARFAAKKEELDDSKRTYCHLPTCSTYIGQSSKNEDAATCSSCAAVTCIPCKQTKHDGDCARDEAIEETLKLAESEGWQKCPACERMVELRTGCNHMT